MCQLINMKVEGVLFISLLMLHMHASLPTSNTPGGGDTSPLASKSSDKSDSASQVSNVTDENGSNNNDDDAAPLSESNNKGDDVAPLPKSNNRGDEVATLPESNNKGDDVAPLSESNNKGDDIAPLSESNNKGDDVATLPESYAKDDDIAPLPESNAKDDDVTSLPESNNNGDNVASLPASNITEGKGVSFAVNNKADNEERGRIIGGQIYEHGLIPWQISLNYQGTHSCGGSILNEMSILTAAHCVDTDPDVSQYTVVVGEHNFTQDEGTEFTFAVQTIIIHQCYNVTNFLEHDIAILHLSEPLTYTDYIQPVTLSDYRFDYSSIRNSNCYASGWGSIDDYDVYPDTVHAVRVNIARNSRCNRKMVRHGFHIFFPNVCTLNNGKATCSGDSGGPLGCFDIFNNYRQIGITSWGLNPCSRNPSIYTRVSYYARWINENMLTNYYY